MALHLKLYCLKVVYSISGWSTVEAVAGAGAGQAGRHKGVARGGEDVNSFLAIKRSYHRIYIT